MAPNPPGALDPAVDGGRGTPANDTDSVPAHPAASPGGDDGSSSSRQRQAPPRPKLLLDSVASIHVVGDSTLLCNLRDAPAGMRVRVANGNTLPVTKIGDIQMTSPLFTIPDVHLAPGLDSDLISIRVLTRQSRICTWFDGDRAALYAGPELVGEAVAPKEQEHGLYVLQFLSVTKAATVAASSDGEMKLVPMWHGRSSSTRGSGYHIFDEKRMFSAGLSEKPMRREPQGSIRIQREPMWKMDKCGRWIKTQVEKNNCQRTD